MKNYDFKKAERIIEENKTLIDSASLGMAQDWFWTADTVFENGAYNNDLARVKMIAGIEGSSWATPSLKLNYKDGSERLFECFKGESDRLVSPLSADLLGPLSGQAQDLLPNLEVYENKNDQLSTADQE